MIVNVALVYVSALNQGTLEENVMIQHDIPWVPLLGSSLMV